MRSLAQMPSQNGKRNLHEWEKFLFFTCRHNECVASWPQIVMAMRRKKRRQANEIWFLPFGMCPCCWLISQGQRGVSSSILPGHLHINDKTKQKEKLLQKLSMPLIWNLASERGDSWRFRHWFRFITSVQMLMHSGNHHFLWPASRFLRLSVYLNFYMLMFMMRSLLLKLHAWCHRKMLKCPLKWVPQKVRRQSAK